MDYRKEFEEWIQGTRNFKKYQMSLRLAANGQYKDFRVNTQWRAFTQGVTAVVNAIS